MANQNTSAALSILINEEESLMKSIMNLQNEEDLITSSLIQMFSQSPLISSYRHNHYRTQEFFEMTINR